MAEISSYDYDPLRDRPKKHPKRKPPNPIEVAIKQWAETLPQDLLESIQTTVNELLLTAPGRWVAYPPMVLLPSGSFRDKSWRLIRYHSYDAWHLDLLWNLVLEQIGQREGKGRFTHLAINEPIPLKKDTGAPGDAGEAENILRTPSGLITLYGDFGPALDPYNPPSLKDLDEAFWASTKQNGIIQYWAPRYTMFSRGNVTEKQRLLDFHAPEAGIKTRPKSREELKKEMAVDLYAGIGYFVFSYVKMGFGKVLGWELNPWSVEGLRRGALANGWSVKIVRASDPLEIEDEDITIMLEDNRKATGRIASLNHQGPICHVNCGLLPSSEPSWEMALGILTRSGWLHLHDNVGVKDIVSRKESVEDVLRKRLKEEKDDRELHVEHTETVKSFAPGVFHMVFDVYVYTQP